MNAKKWKSVVVSIDTYRKLKALAVANHRTLSGQFTHIIETASNEGSDERVTQQT
jgi:hypothetical protein